jgi:transketolase
MSRNINELENKAKQLRKDVIEMIYNAQSGHIGGALSMMDVLVALFYEEMDYDPTNVNKIDRDRFILSKGHTAPALYTILADVGYFPKEKLMTSYRRINGMLQGHPAMKKTPGVEMTSGSLGIGLSAANGMALGNRHQNIDSRIYCMMGDGEINEGQIWEAAATAAQYKINTITAFIDMNGLQNDAPTKKVKDMFDVAAKWEAFGWRVFEINGHDFNEIFTAIDEAKKTEDRPSIIICHTIKGKGVSFMENVVEFHGKTPSKEEYLQAIKELS